MGTDGQNPVDSEEGDLISFEDVVLRRNTANLIIEIEESEAQTAYEIAVLDAFDATLDNDLDENVIALPGSEPLSFTAQMLGRDEEVYNFIVNAIRGFSSHDLEIWKESYSYLSQITEHFPGAKENVPVDFEFPDQMLSLYTLFKDPVVSLFIAGRSSSSPQILKSIYDTAKVSVEELTCDLFALTSFNGKNSSDLIEFFDFICIELAGNESTPVEILEELKDSCEDNILIALLKNASVPDDVKLYIVDRDIIDVMDVVYCDEDPRCSFPDEVVQSVYAKFRDLGLIEDDIYGAEDDDSEDDGFACYDDDPNDTPH